MVGDAVLCTAEENSVVSVSADVPRWRWTGSENGVCWGISSGSPTLSHSVTTALECISICTRYAVVIYDDNSNPSGCWCEGYRWWEETFPTTRGFNVAFPYEFKFWETQPSNVVRQRDRERRESNARKADWWLCPDGKKACTIMDGEGLSYEIFLLSLWNSASIQISSWNHVVAAYTGSSVFIEAKIRNVPWELSELAKPT
ncbi:hypothetical protein L486_07328 [Kwoniella mangroviensis CBS 10435]|uniref:Uncharacterized protein n=1 Tax=Kwoniella mangroviensis CBS 10435 TaxID=1331196 RepID=A0A1B9II60_9TREE|nr:hypothetical protein L486_07328 [Kwoniella mangroviensis CBS 10435]